MQKQMDETHEGWKEMSDSFHPKIKKKYYILHPNIFDDDSHFLICKEIKTALQ